MAFSGFARTTALASCALASVGMVSAEATQLDPARFVASIYANGAEAGVWDQWLDAARREIC